MNKKGNTLVEVIVSFVVVSIICFALINVYLSSKKITKNLNLKENIIAEIDGIYNVFSSDPSDFLNNLKAIYTVKEDTNFIIYYNNTFKTSTSVTENYLELTYTANEEIYNLTINTFVKGKLLNKYSNLSRSVIDRVI